MVKHHTFLARAFACVVALSALLALSLHWVDLVNREGLSPPTALVEMSFFFTILTTALVVVTFARLATMPNGVRPVWQCALMLSSAMVGIVYWALLAGINPPAGLGVLANYALHAIVPVAVFAWWLAYAPKGELMFADVPAMAIWPVLYCSYALTRGQMEASYPYPFLDVLALGWPPVLINIAELGVGFLVAGLVVVGLSRVISRLI